MFFLSSPPPQPSPFYASTTQQSRRPSFSTSHAHDNTYGRAYARAYYAPHSPSPLRTTRNANLMASSPQGNGHKNDHVNSLLSSSPLRSGLLEHHDENRMESENEEENEVLPGFRLHTNVQETPTGKTTHNFEAYGCEGQPSLITPPDSGSNRNFNSKFFSHEQSTSKTSPSTFSFTNPSHSAISATSNLKNPSQWELRSRSSSPSSLLTSQTNRNREQRKSKFLDRIRRRRDDERSEQVGEQVLRMDFVKERRGWEEEMARRAAVEAALQEEIESDGDGDDEEEQELSPIQEYEEDIVVDELVREYERENMQVLRDDEFVVEDAEDEEYARLFREMEILSQHSQSQSQKQPASQPRQEYEQGHDLPNQPTNKNSFLTRPPPRTQQHVKRSNDETMDLS